MTDAVLPGQSCGLPLRVETNVPVSAWYELKLRTLSHLWLFVSFSSASKLWSVWQCLCNIAGSPFSNAQHRYVPQSGHSRSVRLHRTFFSSFFSNTLYTFCVPFGRGLGTPFPRSKLFLITENPATRLLFDIVGTVFLLRRLYWVSAQDSMWLFVGRYGTAFTLIVL